MCTRAPTTDSTTTPRPATTKRRRNSPGSARSTSSINICGDSAHFPRPLPPTRRYRLVTGSAAAVTDARLVALGVVAARFARRGDILSAGAFEDVLGTADPLRIIAVDAHQDFALLHHALVALRLIFGHAHADERADQPAESASRAHSGQS